MTPLFRFALASILFIATIHARAQTTKLSEKDLFGFGIEGPAVDLSSTLYAVNFKTNGTIGRMAQGRPPELWLTLLPGQIASSLRLLNPGVLLVAERKTHQLLKITIATKTVERLAQDSSMNQPNDLTVSREGAVYMSDPSWSRKKSGAIWRWENGKGLTRVADDLKAVNGIALSPDEKTLFYTESIGGGLWSFQIEGSKLLHKKLLHQFEADTVDGLRVNAKGDLFVARIGKGQIDRVSAGGKIISTIKTLGKDPTNLAFGGTDGKTVYVTQRDGRFIESFQTDEPGLEWKILKAAPAKTPLTPTSKPVSPPASTPIPTANKSTPNI